MRFFLALLLLFLASCGDSAEHDTQPQQPTASSEVTRAALQGGWVIAYRDTAKGIIKGRAFIDPDSGYGEATFRHSNPSPTTVFLQSIGVDGPNVILLWGKTPPTQRQNFRPLGQNVGTKGLSVTLALGDTQKSVTLGQPAAPDGTITTALTYYPDAQSFAGHWGQRVDAVTGDAGGDGRTGVFSYGMRDYGGGIMTGEEMWTRPTPAIQYTFSIKPQFAMALDGPAFPYPFKDGASPSRYETSRLVFVHGQNLPRQRAEGIEVKSLDDDVTYDIYAMKNTFEPREGEKVDTGLRDDGFAKIDQIKGSKRTPSGDYLILEATLKPGVKPGHKALTINGVETAWLLRFGDHRASLSFARDLTLGLAPAKRVGLAPETQQTDLVYSREEIVLELRTRVTMPFSSFRVMISKNGKQLKFGDERGVLVTQLAEEGALKVYRSSPIHLIKPGDEALHPPGALLVPVAPGDTLNAALDGPQVLNLDAPLASAKVILNPANLLAAIQGNTAPKGLLWREAVLKAAQCADVSGASSMSADQISRQEADSYSNMVIGTLWRDVESILKTRINIGEHAGAIMMRPVFIAMMEAAAKTYDSEMDDAAILGLRRTLNSTATGGNSALGQILVTAPSGPQIPAAHSFYDWLMETKYGLKADALEQYQISAMRSARVKLAKRIRTSLKKAQDTDACDVRDMLYLTGFGWQDVERRTHAALMTLKNISANVTNAAGQQVTVQRAQWVADRQAHARVSNVALYAKTLKEQEKLSDESWDEFFLTVSLLTLPIGIGAEALAIESAIYATALMDVTDLAINVLQETSKQYREEVELDFARGASVVLGTGRLRQAELDDSSFLSSYIKIAASGAQVANAAFSFKSAARLQRATKRGDQAIKAIRASRKPPHEAFLALKPTKQLDIMRTIVHAKSKELELGRKLLSANELKALTFGRALNKQGMAATAAQRLTRPDWAKGLTENAWLRLEDMILRPDIRSLVAENAAAMNRYLLDEEAIELLRIPQDNLASFERALAREQNRARAKGPEGGQRFLSQMGEAKGSPEDLFFDKMRVVEIDGQMIARLKAFAGQSQGGTKLGEWIRSRVPDTQFQTGKDMFVLELATTNRMNLPDELLATPGRFVPGSPTLDMTALRRRGKWGERAGPRWIRDVDIPLREGDPGVPLNMFGTLRTANGLGFTYADPRLGVIKLKQVASANTAGELHWLRHAYPTRSVNELFRYTHSYRYARNIAEQMGFRVSEVRVVGAVPGEAGYIGAAAPLEEQVMNGRWFDPGSARTAQEAEAAQRAFIERYSVPGHPMVPQSFDVYLKLEPL